jgi:hypothetical protein
VITLADLESAHNEQSTSWIANPTCGGDDVVNIVKKLAFETPSTDTRHCDLDMGENIAVRQGCFGI